MPEGDRQERGRQGRPDEIPDAPPAAGGGEGRGRGGSGVGDEAPAAPPTPDEMVATLMAFDKNTDGKLTKAEVPERMQGMFARADANHDGVLTADEIKTAAAAQPQPAANRAGGEGRARRGRPRWPPRRSTRCSRALDQDGDGALSADEIAGAAGRAAQARYERQRHRVAGRTLRRPGTRLIAAH